MKVDSCVPAVDDPVVAGDAARAMAQASDFPARPFLATRRLRLRELCLADIPPFMAMNSDAEVARWLVEPCPTGYFDVARIVFQANYHYLTRPGLGVWHASDRDGAFVGVFSLMPIEGTDEVEIGARLRPETWGRLYSVEGCRALCEHAFARLDLPRLIGLCHPRNAAVPAILRRLGFSADGETQHFGNRALRHVLRRDAWLAWQSARPGRREIIEATKG